MKLLVIGSGGREHAIAKKLLESSDVTTVYAAPGNPGMELDGIDTVEISISEHDALINFAKEQEITYTFVGPDDALAAGIVDAFQAAGLLIFGPTQAAAELEWSKDYAKSIMNRYQVPTAEHQTFSDIDEAVSYIASKSAPIVIKADGLALGKGVLVAETVDEAIDFTRDILTNNKFGKSRVIVEEFLDGEEFSLFAFVKDDKFYIMPTAQDHKRAYDGDKGPNTGGMGAYSPVPHLAQSMVDEAVETIIKPVVNGMIKEGRPYTGILYAGLILTKDGPKVIEFNARFGDPETQVILPRLTSDFAVNMLELLTDKVPNFTWLTSGVTLGVVVASEGYPGDYAKGARIPSKTSGEMITYYAGVATDNENQLVTSGGRVYLLATTADTVSKAQEAIYTTLATQETTGLFYRNDIGDKAHV
ncbi:phosphoribosylamine--glycine ligase [Pseudolactococcus plantarum]|uniref:Phosphoribosylamine--glycine ligase n=1 Tax=Pseudolactococcus plantarum TaxID=1365 RepID=A0A2A5S1S8_9LACT|nr:phosphoribosylamine--glycine ligase [Lactococcus plantarum]PCS07402.1 phosphoribosylamine--glycine ligase [Lactococcus plantarum]HCN75181.1 phosphoribosylamine--glycine ligase [Lactococcus sp.]